MITLLIVPGVLIQAFILSAIQVNSPKTAVFSDGNSVFASLLHHVCHLALCAWAAPDMCQPGGLNRSVAVNNRVAVFILE